MIKSEISEIVSSKHLKLRKWKLIEYYSPTILFLLMSIGYFIFIIKAKIDNNTITLDKIMSDIGFPIVSLLFAIILFVLYRRELKFKTIDLKVSKGAFHKAIDFTQIELKWLISEKNDQYVIAHSRNNYGGSGETIRIIKKHNLILINSIHNSFSNPLSARNNENIEAFKKMLTKASVQQSTVVKNK
ncbi:hypothetical protein [Winogradskyella ouciana]|uniref:Uncharacterized protein n=1 Tax=Winogradskyella ouciana TaxID=2608631 RepID=A0A7K1GDA5_9FLAO|nr:hypothetical protein [Winogradskyella ouciana]MTE27292.1 hypothetical protein [Winogradskyella ouciana]